MRQQERRGRARRGRGERGFTLIEVMVASAVFLIGIIAVFGLDHHVIMQTDLANNMSLASNLASSGLEELRMLPFDRVVGSSDCSEASPILPCHFEKYGVQAASKSYFFRTWTAVTDADLQVTDVTVNVTWAKDGGIFAPGNPTVTLQGRVTPK